MSLKRTVAGTSRAGGAIERFIERTLAPRLEELTGEIRGLRGEMQQLDKRLSEGISSLRNETIARIDGLRAEVGSRFEAVNTRIEGWSTQVNTRIDGLSAQVNTRIDGLSAQVNGRIDALTQRLDDALNIRERLVALEARVEAQKRNGT